MGVQQMPADVLRWRGGPGSGKTTQLIGYLADELERGMCFEGIHVMTFSRSQATDLRERIGTILPDLEPTDIKNQVRTIDSSAFRACRLSNLIGPGPQHIMTPGSSRWDAEYEKFMSENNLPYDPQAWQIDQDDEGNLRELQIGNQILILSAHLSNTMKSVNDWMEVAYRIGLKIDIRFYDVPHILANWSSFKREREYYEHPDYVRLALDERVPPPGEILFIDEFQDVSPLQNALIRHWIDHSDTERVYLAGDEDQSIYGFRGCDPSLFLDISATDLGSTGNGERPVSYRCPRKIMAAAECILAKPSNVSPTPTREGGVSRVVSHSADDLASLIETGASVATKNGYPYLFILSRFRYNANAISKTLSKLGIPCSGIKEGRVRFWTDVSIFNPSSKKQKKKTRISVNLFTLKRAIQKYLSLPDTRIPIDEAETLVICLTEVKGGSHDQAISDLRARSRSTGFVRHRDEEGMVLADDLHVLTGGRRDDILTRLSISTWQQEQIRLCLVREGKRGFEISPELIRIDTIHAGKGLEAEIVILHSGYLKSRLEGLSSPVQLAEERRVYFVGATRASHHLVFLEYGKTPTFPHIQGAWSA
ncbi:MAG: ATP-dependent helicase [Methanocalculus sp. MSAO_Arc2]|nr:MAG: ATP-dependent helicase [Methanocalculus sp. MSAO_Arc2]